MYIFKEYQYNFHKEFHMLHIYLLAYYQTRHNYKFKNNLCHLEMGIRSHHCIQYTKYRISIHTFCILNHMVCIKSSWNKYHPDI